MHALDFFDAVIDACREASGGAGARRIDARVLPYAGVPPAPSEAGVFGAMPAARRDGLRPMWEFLLPASGMIVLLLVPLTQAALTVFTRADWVLLALLLAINAAQVHSAWRSMRTADADVPWDRDWAIGAPALGAILFWRHYRLLPLFWALIVFLLVGTVALDVAGQTEGRLAFATLLERRLQPVAIVLLAIFAVLHLLLLAAPWHARRRIAVIEAFDPALAARHRPRPTSSRARSGSRA